MTKKYQALMDHNKKEYNLEEAQALYRTQKRSTKPPVVKFCDIKDTLPSKTMPR